MGEASTLNLSFFWHMHQPDYRGSDGVMKMPWVFLHAIKDYYEMPWLLSKFKGLKATFNITSPLIEQLNLYSDPLKNDYFLSIWDLHPSKLESSSKAWLIKTCKSTQYETMVRPIRRFDELYNKKELTDDELVDFEVLFMLSWCGNYLRQENSVVKKLFEKGRNFSSVDKNELLFSLSSFVSTILPFYASLQKDGVISISTTPYNHPILPLLIDINNAKVASEHTNLPYNPISLKDDAIEQVKRSIELYEKTFGVKPNGFWPAEGAVDENSIEIYKDVGLKWIATDEAILFKSLKNSDRSNLYKPYHYNGMTIGFRDHDLSDLVGFTHRFKAPQEATDGFIHSLENMAKNQKNATVFVILDGENAWEFYENNAYDYFMTFYAKLQNSSWCKCVTMDEVQNQTYFGNLDTLSAGSWINGNFDTWSGHSEKNRAWEMIYQCKRDVKNHLDELSQEKQDKIKFHFLASECSDWFWWYGDDHMSEFAFEFDALFRDHLINIYHILQMQPPSDLFEPIISHKSTASFLNKPKVPISPIIGGKQSSFFEWLGSGFIDEGKLYSTMDRVRGPIEKIYYGHNNDNVFIAFEGNLTSLSIDNLILVLIIEESGKKLSFDMSKAFKDEYAELVVGERIEIALSLSNFKSYNKIHLRFEIVEDQHIVQTLPGFGSLLIDLDETYIENWFI